MIIFFRAVILTVRMAALGLPLALGACGNPVIGGAVVAGGTAAPATVNALLTLGPSILSDFGIGATVISDTAKVGCAAQAAFNTIGGFCPAGSTSSVCAAAYTGSQVAGGLCAW